MIRIKRDTKKLEEVENDPTQSDEQGQLHKDRLDVLNIEKKGKIRNTITKSKRSSNTSCENKQTLEKVLDKNTSSAEKDPCFIS